MATVSTTQGHVEENWNGRGSLKRLTAGVEWTGRRKCCDEVDEKTGDRWFGTGECGRGRREEQQEKVLRK